MGWRNCREKNLYDLMGRYGDRERWRRKSIGNRKDTGEKTEREDTMASMVSMIKITPDVLPLHL